MTSHRSYHIEACVVSLSQAKLAKQSGADRIEVCAHLETQGQTPRQALVHDICTQVNLPVRVMIRHTAEGYEANERILKKMMQSIDAYYHLPVEGFVVGVMKNNRMDKDAMLRIVNHVSPMKITIHKAIDESEKIKEDINWLNQFPEIDTILTSGGATTAAEGAAMILEMKSIFHGNIMAGGKIIADQLDSLHRLLNLNWYHGRGIVGDLGE